MSFLFHAKTFSPGGIGQIDIQIKSSRRDFVPELTINYLCHRVDSETLYFIPGSQIWDIHCVGEIPDDSPSELADLIIDQAIQGLLPN
jgi:hypothetical protein